MGQGLESRESKTAKEASREEVVKRDVGNGAGLVEHAVEVLEVGFGEVA